MARTRADARTGLRSRGSLAAMVLLSLVLGTFFVWPLIESVRGAFFEPDGSFTLAYVAAVFENPIYLEGFRNSILVASASTALAALIGVPLALLFGRYEFPGRQALAALVPLPLFVPPFVGALGIQKLLGPTGALNSVLVSLGLMDRAAPYDWLREGRFGAVVALTALHLYPILFFHLTTALQQQNPELERAASLLGARGLRRAWRVTLPLAAPSLFAGLTIIFISALTELGVPLLCDYGRVVSVQIFAGLKDIGQNPLVYALVTVTLLFTLLLYGLARLVLGRPPDPGAGLKGHFKHERRQLPRSLRILATSVVAGSLVLASLPNFSVILLASSHDWYETALPTGLTLEHYRAALGHSLVVPSIANSLRYVFWATALDLVLGFSIAWITVRTRLPGRKLLDATSMMPLLLPGLVMAFGYLAISRPGRPLGFLDPVVDPTALLVIAYATRRLPFVVRSTEAGLYQVSVTLEEAARSLGAKQLAVIRRVTLPLVAPHLLAGGLLAFALSMLDVSDSLVLAQKQEFFPVTKAIYELSQLLGNGRYLAAALGVWAMLLLGFAVTVARRVAERSRIAPRNDG
ncbi:MAG TPA: iron ABC transporter permease [Polyangiaceae bacterium]|nr:iron ABC transporter permease [Polyangiaceae bacterium]